MNKDNGQTQAQPVGINLHNKSSADLTQAELLQLMGGTVGGTSYTTSIHREAALRKEGKKIRDDLRMIATIQMLKQQLEGLYEDLAAEEENLEGLIDQRETITADMFHKAVLLNETESALDEANAVIAELEVSLSEFDTQITDIDGIVADLDADIEAHIKHEQLRAEQFFALSDSEQDALLQTSSDKNGFKPQSTVDMHVGEFIDYADQKSILEQNRKCLQDNLDEKQIQRTQLIEDITNLKNEINALKAELVNIDRKIVLSRDKIAEIKEKIISTTEQLKHANEGVRDILSADLVCSNAVPEGEASSSITYHFQEQANTISDGGLNMANDADNPFHVSFVNQDAPITLQSSAPDSNHAIQKGKTGCAVGDDTAPLQSRQINDGGLSDAQIARLTEFKDTWVSAHEKGAIEQPQLVQQRASDVEVLSSMIETGVDQTQNLSDTMRQKIKDALQDVADQEAESNAQADTDSESDLSDPTMTPNETFLTQESESQKLYLQARAYSMTPEEFISAGEGYKLSSNEIADLFDKLKDDPGVVFKQDPNLAPDSPTPTITPENTLNLTPIA